jgi:hypothetical protein
VVERMAGAGTVLVLVLGYLLLVQVMAAAIVLLAQFIVIQVRTLKTLLVQEPPRTPVTPLVPATVEDQGEPQTYRVGGGLRRW